MAPPKLSSPGLLAANSASTISAALHAASKENINLADGIAKAIPTLPEESRHQAAQAVLFNLRIGFLLGDCL